MIKSYQLSQGRLLPVERLDAEVMLFSNPDPVERDLLRTGFKLDEHALASALDPDEVSRIEFHPDNLFLIWKRPENYPAAAACRSRCRPAACCFPRNACW